ncbi:MAG: hypoxanthine phosphoribosyltransferase [Bdellovibrionaceae bacterium]|nr:hypoxanthine phosphoribosyltransferase [Pseudobdellovibrionaceae bacterium]MDW8189850.1 hypoxanthine phosphoribosyltransferase [Pseudobdellovibrionaceae bacterium]
MAQIANLPLRLSPYLSAEKIQSRVKELAREISPHFFPSSEPLIAVCVLKGSFMFYSDLIRELDGNIECEFLAVSSYSGMTSSGEVKVTLDLNRAIEGKNVLLVEDIVDTGLTMNFLIQWLKSRKPKNLKTVALLLKPDALKTKCDLDFVGFKIPNDFVVGYGLDYQGYYRNLPYIAQVQSFN